MIHGAKANDRVQVIGEDGEPRVEGVIIRSDGHGCVAKWDLSLSNTGTVTRVARVPSYVFVYIEPDPPNSGKQCLAPRDLKRFKEDSVDGSHNHHVCRVGTGS